jgi:hypothetical protein
MSHNNIKESPNLKENLIQENSKTFAQLMMKSNNVRLFVSKMLSSTYVRSNLNDYQVQLVDDLPISKAV